MVWGLVALGSATGLVIQGALFLVLVALSALFSAAESSLISLPVFPRRHLKELSDDASPIHSVLRNPNRVLVTVLLGNYLVNVSAAVVALGLTVGLMGGVTVWSMIVAVVAASLLLITLGELVPRAIATVAPDRTARLAAPILGVMQTVLYPAVWLLERFSSFLLRLIGGPGQRRVFFDEEELKQMVEMGQAQGIIEKEEQEMISAVIDFADLTARDIMVPRTDMVAVEDEATVPAIIATIKETGYSRIPVYKEDLDTVVGVVYSKDLIGEVDPQADTPARQVMKQTLFVPETSHLDEVLREMKTRRMHIAIVHDEYGGTAGLLTLEDVLEEIVGDIFDEYDPHTGEPIEWLDPTTALLDARLDIEDVNEALDLGLPSAAGYETLAGFLFHKLGRPGRTGEVVEHDGATFELERVANRRILTVRARVPEQDEEAPEAEDETEVL